MHIAVATNARHRVLPNVIRVAALSSVSLAGGCAAAPSIPVAGAYFPAWLVCSLIGVLGAIVARMVFAAAGLAHLLPLQLLVSLSVGLVCASVAWAFWIGL